MHPYLTASLELELAVKRGENFQSALGRICRAHLFTQGERELIVDAYSERKAKGKAVRPVKHIQQPRPR